MTKTYFRRADGVILLYDVTSERSFMNVRQWIQNIDVSKTDIHNHEFIHTFIYKKTQKSTTTTFDLPIIFVYPLPVVYRPWVWGVQTLPPPHPP
jgi:GTPase SAR1 family protein